MGRKSSAKSQTRPSSSGPAGNPPEAARRSYTGLLTVAIIVLAAGVGVYVATRPAQSETAAAAPAAPARQTIPEGPAANAKFGPHKQDRLPPLPYDPAPARPPDVVRAAYIFAAEHPEITGYVPCFCGCERMGHHGNDDCFVKSRNDAGDVVEWEPHGTECAVCLDITRDCEQMYRSGASARDIRNAIEKKWASFQGGHTPTPRPQ